MQLAVPQPGCRPPPSALSPYSSSIARAAAARSVTATTTWSSSAACLGAATVAEDRGRWSAPAFGNVARRLARSCDSWPAREMTICRSWTSPLALRSPSFWRASAARPALRTLRVSAKTPTGFADGRSRPQSGSKRAARQATRATKRSAGWWRHGVPRSSSCGVSLPRRIRLPSLPGCSLTSTRASGCYARPFAPPARARSGSRLRRVWKAARGRRSPAVSVSTTALASDETSPGRACSRLASASGSR